MEELERTFLAKYLPDGIGSCPHKEIIDLYIPADRSHPTLRIRKIGDKHEMTKKEPISGTDSSHQLEQTIILDSAEYNSLTEIKNKKVHKIRYYYDHEGNQAEIGIFQGDLRGLVLIDFEFKSHEEKDRFVMPDFCLADVTQEKFSAGGILCGKKYKDIESELKRYSYKPIILQA